MIEVIQDNPIPAAETNGRAAVDKKPRKLLKPKKWKLLQKALSKRRAQSTLPALYGCKTKSPMCWAISADMKDSYVAGQIQKWHSAFVVKAKSKKATKSLMAFLEQLDPYRINIAHALKVVGAASFLPDLAGNVEQADWFRVVQSVKELSKLSEVDHRDSPLLYQLLKVELPLVLSYCLDDAIKTKKLKNRSIIDFADSVADNLDGDGWPESFQLARFGMLVASFVRSFALLRKMKESLPEEESLQLEWVVRQTMRLARANGTLIGTDELSAPIDADFLRTMLRMTPDSLDRKVAGQSVAAASKLNLGKRTVNPDRLPETSGQSEWAGLGVLRCSWNRTSPKTAFGYRNRRNWLEIENQVGLIRGDCTPQLSYQGTPLTVDDSITCVCEHIEDEVDYLELDIDYTHDLNIQRQIIFGKQDGFVIIADAILAPEPGAIDYHCEFPLASEVGVTEESETREMYLADKKIRSLVMPLALPEWKLEKNSGTFISSGRRLVLQQNCNARGMYAAVFFDLNSRRSLKPRTWRQLTVAESLKIVGKEVAVAYRIQVGKQQWILYRSVGKTGNRTFFGQNITEEVFLGRVEKDGTVNELVSIE